VKVSKRALLRAAAQKGLSLDPAAVATRQAFDLCRMGDHPSALQALKSVTTALQDDDSRALLLVRQAEIAQRPRDQPSIVIAGQQKRRAARGIFFKYRRNLCGFQE